MDKKEILRTLADNPLLMSAVRTLIESKFSVDEMNVRMSNDDLGQMVRARVEGLQKVDEAFKEIETYRSQPPSPGRENPAF